ncbi:MAG: hypothetical protein AB8B87_04425 [Granulosicoccus sp.]
MSIFLDHVFILTDPGAEVGRRLSDLGIIEGPANTHPGQGTANRRYFFKGFTIELLFINDREEALNGTGRVLDLVNRMSDSMASPFGIVVRESNKESTPGFPNWQYFPDYFHGKLCFHVGENSGQHTEPLCICMPPSLAKASSIPAEYANPDWQLSALDINLPGEQASKTLQHFSAVPMVRFNFGKQHHMHMTFNHGAAGLSENLGPDLPLTLAW